MSNLKKLLPILAIVAIIGVGWFLSQNKKGGGISIPGVSKTYTAKGIQAVIELGIPMKCTYKIGDMEYEGYVKGKQWRGKMQFGDGRQGEVIMKDNCMWSWGDKDVQGVKMCFEPTEDGQDMWNDPQQDTVIDFDYQCRPAAITDAQFNPPANINFMDMDQMMSPEGYNTQDYNTGNYDIPAGVPDSPEDFDMSRYKE